MSDLTTLNAELNRVIAAVAAVANSPGHPLCSLCPDDGCQRIDRESELADTELMIAWNAYCAALAAAYTPDEPR